ncbi:unnamed protein product [Rotaria sp. Silwood2]|nr:unnamed protein product [Rotaria sp. Silwood2]CAF4299067.1 unnamed protein product [Rotaria sp. Silwood2]
MVLPLLRRMTHLEKLTLYLRTWEKSFVDYTHLHNDILVYMLQLHTFIFYISTEAFIDDSVYHRSNDDIENKFINIKYGQMTCIIDHFKKFEGICHVYSIPYTFTRLIKISNHFPNIVFNTVTHLLLFGIAPMKHDFFMRISQNFPILKCLVIQNEMVQSWNRDELKSDKNPFDSIMEYFHLISLDLLSANTDYVVQFLLETRAYLPRLTELKVHYRDLALVTKNFTRDATRRNCSKVKQLIFEQKIYCSNDVYEYFPSL